MTLTTDPPTVIRAATRADVDSLVGLMSEFYAEAGFALPLVPASQAFSTLLDTPALGGAWLAEVDGRAVGHLVLSVAFSMEFGGLRGFVDDLYVDPRARNRGIGAALLSAARVEALTRGLRALCVETGLDDHPARGLYSRAGFVDTGHALLIQPLATPIHAMTADGPTSSA
jgi:GNAT superfamily N-acetyltransferase